MIHRISKTLVLMAILIGMQGIPAEATSQDTALEYRVKAAFLQRFLKFVEWPDHALPPESDLVVGVAGESAILDALMALTDGKIQGHTLVIRSGNDPEELVSQCHVIFIPAQLGHLPREEHPRWKNLTWLSSNHVLTIGEDDDFLAAGGVISFFQQDDKVRFAISKKAENKAELLISSHLMRLAKVVD